VRKEKMTRSNVFNKKKEFKKNVMPLLDKIDAICREEKVPYFFSAAVTSDGEEYSYERRHLTPTDLGIKLPDSEIMHHMMVVKGHEAINPDEVQEFEFEAE
jgi:hypothetical protein